MMIISSSIFVHFQVDMGLITLPFHLIVMITREKQLIKRNTIERLSVTNKW